uniref:Putative cardiolipin synthaselike [Bombyx mori] n=2 Tax=Lepeophtheirus salmonis TaxID=72036 RepID=A0A0K2UZ44_LEPSM
MVSKANTLIQLTLIGAALASPVFGYTDHYTLKGLMGLTAATTFASAVSYAFMKDTYSFSSRSYDHQFGKKMSAFIFFIGFNLFFTYQYPPF